MHAHHRLAEGVASFLVREQRASGALWDWVEKKESPNSHYGHAFFALSCYLLYERTGATRWKTAFEDALGYTLFTLPPKNHAEFTYIALLILHARLKKAKSFSSRAQAIAERIPSMKFQSGPDTNASNNWSALRLVCEAMRADAGVKQAEEEEKKLLRFVLSTQLEDGLFFDYPPKPGGQGVVTPLCYHAATCAALAMYTLVRGFDAVQKALFKGLEVQEKLMAQDGESFWYGRSSNAIFGYACAVYALLTGARIRSGSEKAAGRYTGAAQHLLDWMTRWQWAGGALHILPNSQEKEQTGFDAYMYVSVYNAFAAAMLLLTPGLFAAPLPPKTGQRLYLEEAGLFAQRGRKNGFFYALCAKGQGVAGQRTWCDDTRYYAGQNLALKWQGHDLLPPPPTHATAEAALDPALCGGLPFVRIEEKNYCLHTAEEHRVDYPKGHARIRWSGQPVHGFTLGFPFQEARLLLDYVLTKRLVTHNTHPLEGATLTGTALVFPSKRLVVFRNEIERSTSEMIGTTFFTGRLFEQPARDKQGVVTSPTDPLAYEKLYPKYNGGFTTQTISTHKGTAYAFFEEDMLEGKNIVGMHALYPKDARPDLKVLPGDGMPSLKIDGKKVKF